MMKYHSKREIDNLRKEDTFSRIDAETDPNKNVRLNRQYLLKEPEIRALHVIKSGDAVDEKMWRALWTKGLIDNESSAIMPRLNEHGELRLKWIRNDYDALKDDARFPKDPKVNANG